MEGNENGGWLIIFSCLVDYKKEEKKKDHEHIPSGLTIFHSSEVGER